MAREKRLWLLFLIILTTFVVGVIAMTSYTLWVLRVDALSSHVQISALTARSFENFLTQSLRATELTLMNANLPERAALYPSEMQTRLVSVLRNSPQIRSLSLLDETDQIVASSNQANRGVKLPVVELFPRTQGMANILRVGRPWVGRDFAEGQLASTSADASAVSNFFPLSLSLIEEAQQRKWLVAVNPDYFLNHMTQQFPTELGFMEVLRLDGVRLMSTRSDAVIDIKPDYAGQVLPVNGVEYGSFELTHAGSVQTLTSFRTSSLYPLVLVTHLRKDVALQNWVTEVKIILGVVLPTLLAICVLSIAFYRRQLMLRAQRAESERLQRINAACVFTNTREGIIIAAADGSMLDVNEAFTRITGYSREEVLGKNPRILASGRHDKAYYVAMWAELADKGHWSGEVWNRRKDGGVFAELLTISAVSDTQGKVQQYVAVFSNITSIKEYQHELEHIARYDALTNLPNRMLLADRLRQAMAQAQRREQQLALVFIDLDGFKHINDTYGHDAGDHLLITLANRMKQALRDGDTLARQGGDEFVAVLVDLPGELDCVPLLKRLLDAAAQKVEFAGLDLQVSASMGVAFYSKALDIGMDELLHQADQAMYKAKQAGKNRYQLFGFEMSNPLQSQP